MEQILAKLQEIKVQLHLVDVQIKNNTAQIIELRKLLKDCIKNIQPVDI